MPRPWILPVLVLLAAPAAACPMEEFQGAVRQGQLGPLAEVAATLRDAPSCTAVQRAWAGRLTAVAHAFSVRPALARGEATPEMLATVDAGLRFGRPWQALAMRGDLLQRLRGPAGEADWTAASLAYQEALNDIAETEEAQNPVPPAQIERLVAMAQQTALLASQVVAPPVTRSGRAGGLALTRVRSFAVTAVAQPIHFEFGTDRFTPLGSEAVEQLFNLLQEQGQPSIRLVGHTDPAGSDEVNLRLSLRRAEAVRRALVSRGYDPGRIAVEGRGRRDPLRVAGGDAYTEAELNQMLRRVELVR